MEKPRIDESTSVLVLTGSGVSAESGIPTFRGAGGLWKNHPFEKLASLEGFAEDPALVWRFYSARRKGATDCQPNAGHLVLAELEKRLGDRFLLVTQNVDGLHGAAGSKRMVELHGNLFTTRCSVCTRPPFEDRSLHEAPPICERCGGLLRPHIVWFGEPLDPSHLDRIDRFLDEASERGRVIFLAVGTSGAVYPAAGLVDVAKGVGAETWLVNADPADNTHRFDRFVQGKSGEVLPKLLG